MRAKASLEKLASSNDRVARGAEHQEGGVTPDRSNVVRMPRGRGYDPVPAEDTKQDGFWSTVAWALITVGATLVVSVVVAVW